MSDTFYSIIGAIVTIGFFVIIALFIFLSAGGFDLFRDRPDVIPFPDAKLSKIERRAAIKKRAKERRWESRFGTSGREASKLGKTSGHSIGSSISAAKSFKSSGGSRISAKRSKH